MQINFLVLPFFIILNITFVYFFNNINFFHKNMDKPDAKRKLHKKPIPLAGGIIIFLNIVFYFFFLLLNTNLFFKEILFVNNLNLILFFTICSAIFSLGFLDDKYNISASIKFFVVTAIITLILFLDNQLIINQIKFSFINKTFALNQFSVFFTCFCFLVFLNAFNMFDGINLQSFFYSIIIFFCLLIFYIDILLIKIMLISLISYGYLNFKNKTFLGDSGSLLVSFIISYIFIKSYNLNIINFSDEIVIYMLIPGIDLIRLFFIRILQKKNPLSPDRFHLHHLLLLKFSYFRTLAILIILITMPIFLNFLQLEKIYIIIITVLIYSILIKYIRLKKL